MTAHKETLRERLKAAGLEGEALDQALRATRQHYHALFPPSVAEQLDDLEEGKPFNYRMVIEERMEDFEGEASEFIQEFAQDSKVILNDLEGEARKQFKTAKSYFAKYFERGPKAGKEGSGHATGSQQKKEDPVQKAKEELDKNDKA